MAVVDTDFSLSSGRGIPGVLRAGVVLVVEVAVMRCWRSVSSVVVVVCLLGAGCVSGWDRGMRALREDPMASASWDGLELLGTVETKNDSPTPSPPSISYCYLLAIPRDQAVTSVVSTAEANGWLVDAEFSTPHSAIAEKKFNSHTGTLIVSNESVRCREKYPNFELRISLSHS